MDTSERQQSFGHVLLLWLLWTLASSVGWALIETLLSRGYTGAYLGLYATSNGKTTEAYADFDWVRYQGFPVEHSG